MRQGFVSNHWLDGDGKPEGGTTYGVGFTIGWQRGPLGRGESRKDPNGAFVEDIIDAAKDRLEYYQGTEFACAENEAAIVALTQALQVLDSRTRDRETRQVEGTHAR